VTGQPAVIVCAGVVKRFGAVTALDRLDVAVRPGTVTAFVGPNGAGKSTTLRILVDLARPDAGEVRVLGSDPRTAGPALRRRIGYLPGELRLDERLDVGETFRSWAALRGGVDEHFVRRLCEQLALDPTRATHGLSSGNRRKVGLVGAFMGRPELLILDEPTSGLDPLVQAEFGELVREVLADGRTVFLSSHVLSEVEHLADEVIVIRAGRAVYTGDVDRLRQQARQPFSVWFTGDIPLAELQAAPGVHEVEVSGGEVTGVVEGSPDGLLAVLARFPVRHLLIPEPDFEAAFLRFYEGEGS
jgi:ABC-2 type transport system ATP-binding protein